jgi:hypothetical protein
LSNSCRFRQCTSSGVQGTRSRWHNPCWRPVKPGRRRPVGRGVDLLVVIAPGVRPAETRACNASAVACGINWARARRDQRVSVDRLRSSRTSAATHLQQLHQ